MYGLQNIYLPPSCAGEFPGLICRVLQLPTFSGPVFFSFFLQCVFMQCYRNFEKKKRARARVCVCVRSPNNVKFSSTACCVCYNFFIPYGGKLFNIISGAWSYHLFLSALTFILLILLTTQLLIATSLLLHSDVLKATFPSNSRSSYMSLAFRTVQVLKYCYSAVLYQLYYCSFCTLKKLKYSYFAVHSHSTVIIIIVIIIISFMQGIYTYIPEANYVPREYSYYYYYYYYTICMSPVTGFSSWYFS